MHSIARLKQLLIKSSKLVKVWEYFFDLMDREILWKNSRDIANPEECQALIDVLSAIQESASQQLGRRVTVAGLLFKETVSEHFYQGTCAISGVFPSAAVFYFSDIELGSFTYSKDGRSEMFRFSLTKITDSKKLTWH